MIQTPKQIQYGLQNDPEFLFAFILKNNAEAIDERLYTLYGLAGTVDPSDGFEDIIIRIQEAVELMSENDAQEALMNILDVPVIEYNLSTAEQEAVFGTDYIINKMNTVGNYKSGLFDQQQTVDELNDLQNSSQFGATGPTANDSDPNGINWGGLLEGALGGLMGVLFGNSNSPSGPINTGGSNNPGNNNNNNDDDDAKKNKQLTIFLVILAIIIGYLLYRRFK